MKVVRYHEVIRGQSSHPLMDRAKIRSTAGLVGLDRRNSGGEATAETCQG